MLEEHLRRAVEERMSRELRPADEPDELEVHQRLDVARHVHAADLLDLALRDGLAVRHDRKRLERGAPEPARTVQLEHGAHVPPAARHRLHAVRPARAHELEAASRDFERLLEPLQCLVDLARSAALVDVHNLRVLALLWLDSAHGGAELRGGQRIGAREEKRADDVLKAARQRNLNLFTHSRPAFQAACRPVPPWTAGS